jgi:small subunit ribosomal protein S6
LKKYECLYIVNINFDSEGISAIVAKVEELLKKNAGATVVNTQHWGKRKLAYAIDKQSYGNYVLLHFEGEDPDISEFSRELEIEPGILHYLTIRLDDFPDFSAMAVPQAFEAERSRRPQSRDSGRRPSRNYDDDDEVVKPVDDVAEVDKSDDDADEAVKSVDDVIEAVEIDEPADDTIEEEAEKPADAE